MIRPLAFLRSMTGRMFLVCFVGAVMSITIAMGLAVTKRRLDLEQLQLEQLTEYVRDYVSLVNGASPSLESELVRGGVPQLRPAQAAAHGLRRDERLTSMLRKQLGLNGIVAEVARSEYCVRAPLVPYSAALASKYDASINCWILSIPLRDHPQTRFMYKGQRRYDTAFPEIGPFYIVILILIVVFGIGAASLIAAKLAAAPLKHLTDAANALSADPRRGPLPEVGPPELRSAAKAFNSMQILLRRYVDERQQMLASITHDLQTPLTRLFLRAERIENANIRDRMLSDLSDMRLLIREGLELARSGGIAEPPVKFDLDSMLESIVADAADAGFDVTMEESSKLLVVGYPQSLRRAVSNLVQNALKYAGGTRLLVEHRESSVKIIVRDRGPGIPGDKLGSVIEPFVRLETSRSRETGGGGLGPFDRADAGRTQRRDLGAREPQRRRARRGHRPPGERDRRVRGSGLGAHSPPLLRRLLTR